VQLRVTLFLLCALSLSAQTHSHLEDFKRKLIWRDPLIKTAANALFNEARNSPHEWGQGIDGFAKRAGSSFGRRVVKSSVELGVSEWTHEDLHYHRLGAGSFMTRVKHAVATTYWVPRDNESGYTLAAGRIAGTFAQAQVARLWMPSRVATMGAAMQGTAATVGLDVGINLLREFWPRGH
jgi:hypothetical protein